MDSHEAGAAQRGNGHIEEFEEILRERLDEARSLVEEGDRRLREFVNEQPLLAIGGALLAGYLIGRLLRR